MLLDALIGCQKHKVKAKVRTAMLSTTMMKAALGVMCLLLAVGGGGAASSGDEGESSSPSGPAAVNWATSPMLTLAGSSEPSRAPPRISIAKISEEEFPK